MVVAFDLIELDGEDLPRTPIERRKNRLLQLVQGQHPGIAFDTHYVVDGKVVFKNACALGCEGIVSKRLGSLLPLWPLNCVSQSQESGRAHYVIGGIGK